MTRAQQILVAAAREMIQGWDKELSDQLRKSRFDVTFSNARAGVILEVLESVKLLGEKS